MTNRRSEYEATCDLELSQWDEQIVILTAKTERAVTEVKTACLKSLANLRINLEKIKAKQLELKALKNGTWEEFKEAMEQDRMSLRIAFCGVAAKLG